MDNNKLYKHWYSVFTRKSDPATGKPDTNKTSINITSELIIVPASTPKTLPAYFP